jgi:uncharacterized hydrophobic protein (TIGR00271 family)
MSVSTTPQHSTPKFGFDPGYLAAFQDKLFIEGPQTARRLTNFFALLLFATVIATYGLLSGSTATVIGAMIVAPLMGPIMATTAAVVLGQGRRALRALGLVVAGVATVIAFSFALVLIVPDITISFVDNGELASRINPGLYALLTALGSGAAGAYITSRDELADSIGGVAIAISLVPPLCVVGIALELGQGTAAAGAFLLFATNFLAILLAGGITFLFVGLGKYAPSRDSAKVRQRGFVLIFIATLLVVIPLSATSYQAIIGASEKNITATISRQWLGASPYQILSVNLRDRLVIVSIEGSGELPPLQGLDAALSKALNRPVIVKVRIIPSQTVGGDSGIP